MIFCSPDPNKNLRSNITRVFLPLAIGSLFINALILIIIVVITNNIVITESEDALISQIFRHANDVSYENSKLLSKILTRSLQGSISPIVYSTSDTFRTNYSLGYLPSYFDDGQLDEPLTQDSRQIENVSFSHSSYYFPGTSDISSFSDEQNNTRDKTTHIDNFFIPIYQNYDELIQSYVGFESNGMLRRYPGNVISDRSYDPRLRGWYLGAVNSDNEIVYTSPYRDFFGLGWMITIAQVVNDLSGSKLGVMGGDITITSLQNIINNISFLDSGKVTLFESDGTVVVDRDWDMDKDNPNYFTYRNLTNPTVSTETWNKISSIPADETTNIKFSNNNDEYNVFTTHISDFNEKYYISVFVKKSEILKTINPILNDIKYTNTIVIILLTTIFLAITILITFIIFKTASSIVKPFDDASENITEMVMGLGDPNYIGKYHNVNTGVGIELTEFSIIQNDMVDYIQEHRQSSESLQLTNNEYYQGNSFITALPEYPYPENSILPIAEVVPYESKEAEEQDLKYVL